MKTNISKGKKGEDLAVEFLEKQGIKIIERNWRYSRLGEMDIIAQEVDTLVFVEVKARSSTDYGHPLEAINTNKLKRLYQLAEMYMEKNQVDGYKNFRIDIIAILLGNKNEITHIKNIYQ